jgi:uncharacterized membrane protein (DUF485 family)
MAAAGARLTQEVAGSSPAPPIHLSAPGVRRTAGAARTVQNAGYMEETRDTGSPARRAAEAERRPRLLTAKRIVLAAATILVSINIWTGFPLLAVWVGSQVAGESGLSMGALFAVVAVLAVTVTAGVMVLSWLSAQYDELTGRPRSARRTSPWMRSMRGEREEDAKKRQGVSGIERIVVISVVVAVGAFEVWFFFFAGSSLPR